MSKGLILLLLAFLVIGLPVWGLGQQSGWQTPNPSHFNYSATVISNVLLEDSWENNPSNELAFFTNGELRGLGIPVQTDSGLVYYTTVYSNAPVNELSALFYHADSDQVLLAFGNIHFELYSSTGTILDPFTFRSYLDDDAPVKIQEISSLLTLQGFPFPKIELDDFLKSIDGDPVEWSIEDHSNLSGSLNGSLLEITPDFDFFGETTFWIAVTELTDIGKSDTIHVDISVVPIYSGPLLEVVPGQGVVKGGEFRNLCDEEDLVLIDLKEFEIQSDGCVTFEYMPVIDPTSFPDPAPNWEFDGFFPNSMTILAEAYFSPNFRFMHENDLLAAFIDGELRGVASPVYNNDKWLLYLNVAGKAGDSEIELRYYANELEQILSFPEKIAFKPYDILGTWNQPLALDFIPLLPVLDENGQLELQIKNDDWTGVQDFIFYARDCAFPQFLVDSMLVSYCVVEDSADLNYYYLIGEERGFSEEIRFTRSCSPPYGYVGILEFNCSYDVIIDAEQACAVPIPDLILELQMKPNCEATEYSGISQVPAANSSLIQIADTIIVYLYRQNDEGTNDLCSFNLILDNFGEEVSLYCPPLIEVNAITGDCEAYVELEVAFTEGCGPVSVLNDYSGGGAVASGWYPLGSTEVNFELMEDSIKVDSCTVEVIVQDVQSPTIVCPADITVEVNEGFCVATEVALGGALADLSCGSAETDMVAPAEFEIGETQVLWTATGYNGMMASCVQLVTVEDFQPPVLVCPDDITILADPGGCEATGFEPEGLSATAICGDVSVEYTIPAVLEHGANSIIYTAIGSNGISSECTQWIIVEGEGNISITCPGDIEVVLEEGNCELSGLELGAAAVSGNCNDVGISNNAPSIFFPGETVVTHTAEAGDGTIYNCDQQITLIDDESPIVQCPMDTLIHTDPGLCLTENPSLEEAVASMSCGVVGVISDQPATFYPGTTEVTFTAIGYNGLEAECTYVVTVTDVEDPVVFCPDGVNLMVPIGHTETFVQIDPATAVDNCAVDSLNNSFNDGGADASGIYPVGETTVIFTALDVASNSSTCEIQINITESAELLDTFLIGGQMLTWSGFPVQEVELALQGGTTGEFTNSSGEYEFEVLENQTVIVKPKNNENWLEGISTLDLVLIQGYIIGLNSLGNPYAIIGADANKDGVVSTFDLILLQTLIIGQIESIAGNTSWRFIPSSYNFTDPENPHAENFPELKVYANINSNFFDEDWIAVKTGDASGDAAESGIRELRESQVFNLLADKGDEGAITVGFYLPSRHSMSGYQLEVYVDPGMYELIGYHFDNSVLPNLSELNFLMDTESGVLRTNWWHAPGEILGRDKLLFEITLKPIVEGAEINSALQLGAPKPRFKSEVYDLEGRVMNAEVSWKYNESMEGYNLFQNEPNPFANETIIPFTLPEEMPVKLNIYNSVGKLVESISQQGVKGMNYYLFQPGERLMGIHYYQLITDNWTGVKKMILH
ncbi:MAG: HYR domain-containing protein [Saprospirales bacterium]|nr:MAG: HYR domain-containing protein [Saprospirales bacterium]